MRYKEVFLGELCENVLTGGTPSTDNPDNWNGDLPWVSSADIVDHKTLHIRKGLSNETRPNVLPAGNILVVTRVGLGKAIINETDISFSQDIQGLILKKELVSARYLLYALIKKLDRFKQIARGATIKGVTRNDLVSIKVPLPPLHIQEQIADTLDKADALRKKDQELLRKYDELSQAIFNDMFGDPVRNERGWDYKTLEQISIGRGQYGSASPSVEYTPDKYRYVRITDINEQGILNDARVSSSDNNREYELVEGDLLFARSGATVGKVYMYKESDGPCIYAGYLIRFKVNRDLVLPEYVFSFCKTKYYKNWVASKQNVVAQPNINATQYGSELLIPLPPLRHQMRYVELNKMNDKSIYEITKTLKKSDGIYNYLLQSFFS
jgi:type I restriction enzyme S subunit